MKEIRCKCHKLLAKAEDTAACKGLHILCPKCGTMNKIQVEPKEAGKAC